MHKSERGRALGMRAAWAFAEGGRGLGGQAGSWGREQGGSREPLQRLCRAGQRQGKVWPGS